MDRCDGLGETRVRDYSAPDEAACEPSGEDREAARMRDDHAAEQRRNAWASEGDQRAGVSAGSASMISKTTPSCDGPTKTEQEAEASARRSHDLHMRSGAYTKKTDLPLQDDPVGNAIPGLVVGGLSSGVRAAATSAFGGSAKNVASNVAHESIRMAGAIGRHAAEDVAAEAITHGAEHGAHAAKEQIKRGVDLPAAKMAPSGPSPSGPGPAAVGRSGARGVSEPVERSGGMSHPAVPTGQDRIPFQPGMVPVRIPEAPQAAIDRPVRLFG